MTHTVTIDEKNLDRTLDEGSVLVMHKEMWCSCGWAGTCEVLRAHAMAKHHLMYTHGHGRIIYMGAIDYVS